VLTAVGVLTLLGWFAESWATIAFVLRPEAGLPGAVFAAWIHNWYWYPLLGLLLVFVPMLYPTGRPLTPRWNWLYYAAVMCLASVTLLSWLRPTLTDGSLQQPAWVVDNPIGVSAAGDIETSTQGAVLFAAMFFLAAAAIVSLIVRFRRSRGVERQQMKLFVFAGVIVVAVPLSEELVLRGLLPESNLLFAIAIALPPIAIGVAVARYRLYEIDRLISRTVSYAVLTVALVAVYLVAVTLLTTITAPVTGESPIAVAAATLLAAAAFGPARRRIQAAVDRRFNRARFDATRTVDEFRAGLRDEVDLAAVTASIRGAVERTLQPSNSVVWLRHSAERGDT
jgi:membrane protease YdiL (CAAX protease family)